jgi:hypothetical protein
MNTVAIQSELFSGSGLPKNYFWKNMAIEKRSSTNWLQRLYKESPVKDFWSVLTSRIN